jgi:branched-chain amino acid transport system ATP-binding protein
MLLELSDVSVAYGSTKAVSDLTLGIPHGEIVTVLGANGAGKSSLLAAIMGATPNKGNIRFNAQAIDRWSTGRRVEAGIILVPEGRRILLSLTIAENLLMGACQRRDSEINSDLNRIYDLFPNLARRRHALGSVLSGGEQQMLAIGRALMARPKLLLLDEPSLGLSPLLVRDVFRLISKLNNDTGLAILLVEQNTRLALRTANYGYVLRLGRLIAQAPTLELMNSPEIINAYLGGDESSEPSPERTKELIQ